MNAGTSTPRTNVASIRIAIPVPIPNSWMNDTLDVPNARNVTVHGQPEGDID